MIAINCLYTFQCFNTENCCNKIRIKNTVVINKIIYFKIMQDLITSYFFTQPVNKNSLYKTDTELFIYG